MRLDIPEATVTANHGFVRISFDDACSLGECLGESISEVQNDTHITSMEAKLKRIREIAAACVGSCDSADALILALELIERVAENEDALAECADTVEQILKALTV